MEFLQEITLELNSNTAYTTVGAKQGDSNSRTIIVHITQNGQDYNLQEQGVTSAYFRFRKPDGKAIINTAPINFEENIISLTFSAQTLAAAGRGYADITLMSGSSILSTVSFIVIIMSSPQVAGQAVSSNEFGYLNSVVEDATHIIYEAQAWATGTRGTEPVYGEDSFTITKESEVISEVSVDQSAFITKVGSRPGLKRIFSFDYSNDNRWILTLTTIEGNTEVVSEPEVISQISDYNITIGFSGGINTPNPGDNITINFSESDNTFENNAKYYAEQAAGAKQAIEDLTVDAETVPTEQGASVEKTIIDDVVNLNFKIPKGDTGDVYFMTFHVDIETGELIMTKPDHISPQVDFVLNNNDGNLYFEIQESDNS